MVIRLRCLSVIFGLLLCGSLFGAASNRSLTEREEPRHYLFGKTNHLTAAGWHGIFFDPRLDIESVDKAILVSLEISHPSTSLACDPWASFASMFGSKEPDTARLSLREIKFVREGDSDKVVLGRWSTDFLGKCQPKGREKNRFQLVCNRENGEPAIEIQVSPVKDANQHFQNAHELAKHTDLEVHAEGIRDVLQRLLKVALPERLKIPLIMTSALEEAKGAYQSFAPAVLLYVNGLPQLGSLWRHLPYPGYTPPSSVEGTPAGAASAEEEESAEKDEYAEEALAALDGLGAPPVVPPASYAAAAAAASSGVETRRHDVTPAQSDADEEDDENEDDADGDGVEGDEAEVVGPTAKKDDSEVAELAREARRREEVEIAVAAARAAAAEKESEVTPPAGSGVSTATPAAGASAAKKKKKKKKK